MNGYPGFLSQDNVSSAKSSLVNGVFTENESLC